MPDLPIDPAEWAGTPEYQEEYDRRQRRRLYQRFVEYEASMDDVEYPFTPS